MLGITGQRNRHDWAGPVKPEETEGFRPAKACEDWFLCHPAGPESGFRSEEALDFRQAADLVGGGLRGWHSRTQDLDRDYAQAIAGGDFGVGVVADDEDFVRKKLVGFENGLEGGEFAAGRAAVDVVDVDGRE